MIRPLRGEVKNKKIWDGTDSQKKRPQTKPNG